MNRSLIKFKKNIMNMNNNMEHQKKSIIYIIKLPNSQLWQY